MSKDRTLMINEIFYSIQGESLSVGEPTTFIRLSGCPLRCSYCDTNYAFKDGKEYDFDKILKVVRDYNSRFVTVTGGEPLAQTNCISFLDLIANQYNVSLETSNAYSIREVNTNVTIVLDVKTPKSNESDSNMEENYNYLKNTDQIKFVICDLDDYEWSKKYINDYKLLEKCNILFSPSYDEMPLEDLANRILDDNLPVRLQFQFHKYIWGDVRGK